MKHGATWSYGILMVMGGIVLGVLGIMRATMLPGPGFDWHLALVGAGCVILGLLLAVGDRLGGDARRQLLGAPAEDTLPRARARERSRRR